MRGSWNAYYESAMQNLVGERYREVKKKIYIDLKRISFEQWDTLFQKCYTLVSEDYNNRKRTVIIKGIGKRQLTLPLAHFLVNMCFWMVNIYYKTPLTRNDVFKCSDINKDTIAARIDQLIEKFLYHDDKDNSVELNLLLSEVFYRLSLFSVDFNPIIGNTINLYDKAQLAIRNAEYNDIIHTKLDETKSYHVLETEIRERTERLIELLKREPNCFRPFLRCGEGINFNQLAQFEVCIGMKPDLDDNIYPYLINTNFLMGLRNAADYFIDSCGGRKAEIIRYMQVGRSGYLTRQLTLLCIDTKLDRNSKACDTRHLITININDARTLNRLNGRYIRLPDGSVQQIWRTDTDRIGQTVELYSPITCVAPDGICARCYGHLYDINKNIHVGIFGVNELTAQLTQLMISAKHVLKTDSEEVTWPEGFDSVFLVIKNRVFMNPAVESDELMIRVELHREHRLRNRVYTQSIGLVSDRLNRVRLFELDRKLYLTDSLLARIERDPRTRTVEERDGIRTVDVPIERFESPMFFFRIENRGLSDTLNKIHQLIVRKVAPDSEYSDLNRFCNRFLELLNGGNIYLDSVHMEIIIRELVRDRDDLYHRPDFRLDSADYRILRVTDAILKSASLVRSLSFERIKNQLYNWETFAYKKEPSMLDVLFRCERAR